jgi:dolichol kinase
MVWAWVACVAGIVAFQFAIGRGQSGNKGAVYGALRSDPHAKRRAQHVITGLMIYVASGWFSAEAAVLLLFSCALALYCVHIARKRYAEFNKMYVEQLGALMRPAEINHTVLPGAFYFLVGCGMVIALFPHDIARLAILHVRNRMLGLNSANVPHLHGNDVL